MSSRYEDALFNTVDVQSLTRALALVVRDEVNLHSSKVNEILDAIDNATSLAEVKTAVALITDLPQRSIQDVRDAVQGKIGQ